MLLRYGCHRRPFPIGHFHACITRSVSTSNVLVCPLEKKENKAPERAKGIVKT
jgi:hypothetical protein